MAAEEADYQKNSSNNWLLWSLAGASSVASLLLIVASKRGDVKIQLDINSALNKMASSAWKAGSMVLSKLTDVSILAGIAGSSIATIIGCEYQARERDKQLHIHQIQQEQQAILLTCKKAEAHEEKAIIFYKKGKYHESQKSLSLAIDIFNNMHDTNTSELMQQRILKLKYYKAKCLLHSMQLEKCTMLLEEVIAEREDYVGALNLRGLLFFLQQDFARAKKIFYRSLSYNNRQNIIDKLIQCCELQLESSLGLCFSELNTSVNDMRHTAESAILAESILRAIELTKATSFFTPILLDIYVRLHLNLRNNTSSANITAMSKKLKHHINAIAFAELFLHLYDKDIRFKPVVSKMLGHLAVLYNSLYGSEASSSSSGKTSNRTKKSPVVQVPSFIEGVKAKEVTPQEARSLSFEYQQQKQSIDNEMVYTAQKILKC